MIHQRNIYNNLSPGRKEYVQTFLLVVLYAAGFYGLQFFLYSAGMVQGIPNETNLTAWDAHFYKFIVDNGYKSPLEPAHMAFFPLFPFIWKLSHVGVWGICVVNIVLFAIGFSVLSGLFKLNSQNKILWLSIPAIYFTFIPYTEALFFLLLLL